MPAGFQGTSPNARFLIGDVPEGEHQKLRVGNALSFSFLSHVAGILIAIFVMSLPGAPPAPPASFDMPRDIVWVAQEGPGGGGGGGAAAAQAGRVVDLAASREKVRRGRRVRLRGDIEAFANAAQCERGVEVELQRRRPARVPFRTFARRTTSSTGGFRALIRPRRTRLYRALVRATAVCLGAASDRQRVGVIRRAAAR
jgi:hypothetical protein